MTSIKQVHTDFQRELDALVGKKPTVATEHFQDSGRLENDGQTETLKAPSTEVQRSVAQGQQVTEDQLFGDDAIEGEIPELKQDFVMLKSKQDRLIEMGQVAQEVFQTRLVCRQQVMAMESFARELIPPTETEKANDQRQVMVADHEINMYTEEPSGVAVQSVIDNSQVAIDAAVGQIKSSALVLAEKIISVGKSDMAARNEMLTNGIGNFNRAVIKFLENTEQANLEDAKIKFRRNLNWGNLMAMGIDVAHNHAMGYDRDSFQQEKSIASFDGTTAEKLFKDFGNFVAENPLAMPVISNFIAGSATVIRNSDDLRTSLKDKTGDTYIPYSATFGHLFTTFGSPRFTEFFLSMNDYIDHEIKTAMACMNDLRDATDLDAIRKNSIQLQINHANIMAATANIAVICAVQQMVKNFLETFK